MKSLKTFFSISLLLVVVITALAFLLQSRQGYKTQLFFANSLGIESWQWIAVDGLSSKADKTHERKALIRQRVRLASSQILRAVEEIENAIREDPDHVELYIIKGDLNQTRGFYNEALIDYQEAKDKLSSSPPGVVHLGVSLDLIESRITDCRTLIENLHIGPPIRSVGKKVEGN